MGDQSNHSLSEAKMRVGICGEVSSGKSTVLQSILRQALLPDFFGVESRPLIRVTLGAETAETVALFKDGSEKTMASPLDVEASDNLLELSIFREEDCGLGACELVEVPALRDGHLDPGTARLLGTFDILVWTTIGSQAWRLSEKNILDELMSQLPERRILVATRADKFRSDGDRQKLRDRLERETTAYFSAGRLLGVSPALLSGKGKSSAWETAGVADFVSVIAETLSELRALRNKGISEDHLVQTIDESATSSTPFRRRPRRRNGRTRVLVSRPPAALDETPLVEVPMDDWVEDARPDTESNWELVENVEHATQVGHPSNGRDDPISDFIKSLHGVIAFGSVNVDEPDEFNTIFGDEEKVAIFAAFSAISAKAMQDIAGFGGTDPDPESEQVAMTHHNVLYRLKGGVVLFLAGETATLSTGIARTAFQRLSYLFDHEIDSADKAA